MCPSVSQYLYSGSGAFLKCSDIPRGGTRDGTACLNIWRARRPVLMKTCLTIYVSFSFSTYRLWHMQWAVTQGYSPLTFAGFWRCCSLTLSIGYRKYCILTQKACRFPHHTTVRFTSGTIPQRCTAISGTLPQRYTANIRHTTTKLYG
jgi:hypothetical protein